MRYFRWLAGAVCVASLCSPAGALADGPASTTSALPAPNAAAAAAIQTAASQPTATSLATLQQQAAALQSSVDSAVSTGGHPAVQELIAAHSDAVNLALVNGSKTWETTTTDTSSPTTPLSTSCHPEHTTTINSGPDSADILAWRSIKVYSGWCTNGSIITSWNGIYPNEAITAEGDLMALCWAGNPVAGWSWENVSPSHSWLHARNWQDYGPGVSYIGCVADQPVDPVIRIAGNGYWDSYNDY